MQAAHFPFRSLQCGVASPGHPWAYCKRRCLLMSSQVKTEEEGRGSPKECPLLYIFYIISWLPKHFACSGPLPWASSLSASAGTGVYEPPATTHGLVRDLAIGQTIRIGVKTVSLQVESCTCVVWLKGRDDMGFQQQQQ